MAFVKTYCNAATYARSPAVTSFFLIQVTQKMPFRSFKEAGDVFSKKKKKKRMCEVTGGWHMAAGETVMYAKLVG